MIRMVLGLTLVYRLNIIFEFEGYLIGWGDAGLLRNVVNII